MNGIRLTKVELARILSVSERTVRDWLSRIDKDAKEARDQRIFDMWMACHTQAEVSGEVGVSQQEVSRRFTQNGNVAELSKPAQAAATHATDFQVPVYNIWSEQKRQNQSNHFGNTHVRWLDNLLYLYTDPFDIVVDPYRLRLDRLASAAARALVGVRAGMVSNDGAVGDRLCCRRSALRNVSVSMSPAWYNIRAASALACMPGGATPKKPHGTLSVLNWGISPVARGLADVD